MRRKDREISDNGEILKVIEACECCRLGFYDEDSRNVYIVPMNFGFATKDDKITLYFHSANEGRKISLISRCEDVGFEMDCGYKLNEGEKACDYSAGFLSVIGNGKASFIDKKDDKITALNLIMNHATKEVKAWEYDDNMLDVVCIFKVEITDISCKFHK